MNLLEFSSQTLVRRILLLGPISLERRLTTLRRQFNSQPAEKWPMLIYNETNYLMASRRFSSSSSKIGLDTTGKSLPRFRIWEFQMAVSEAKEHQK